MTPTIWIKNSSAARPCEGLPPRDSSITICVVHNCPADVPHVDQVSLQPPGTARTDKLLSAPGCAGMPDSELVARRQVNESPSASTTGTVMWFTAFTAMLRIGTVVLRGEELPPGTPRSIVV